MTTGIEMKTSESGAPLRGTMVKAMKPVAVSCGYDTCFAVRTSDGLCHLTLSMDCVRIPLDYTQKSTRSTLALKLSVSPPFYPWVTATKPRPEYCLVKSKRGEMKFSLAMTVSYALNTHKFKQSEIIGHKFSRHSNLVKSDHIKL